MLIPVPASGLSLSRGKKWAERVTKGWGVWGEGSSRGQVVKHLASTFPFAKWEGEKQGLGQKEMDTRGSRRQRGHRDGDRDTQVTRSRLLRARWQMLRETET